MSEQITVEQLDGLILEMLEQKKICVAKKELATIENIKFQELEAKAYSYLEELGKTDYRSELATISRSENLYYSLPKDPENRKEYFDHLKEKELFDSMVTVNAASHNAFCNSEFDACDNKMEFSVPGVAVPSMRKKLNFRKR